MVKVREKDKESAIAEFVNNVDQIKQFDATAPRGKKRGGADTLLPMNAYEYHLLKEAAQRENRSLAGFIRASAVAHAKDILK